MEEINSKTHVLVLPCPVQGHINPIVQFSKILASKEVKVTILTIDFVCKAMLLDCGPLINIESIPHEAIPVGLENFLEWFQTLMLEKFSGIVEKFGDSEYPVKVVVIDSIISWIIDLAHELGLKVAALHTQPVALSVLYYHIDQEDSTNKIPFECSVPVSLSSLPLLEKEDLPSFICETHAYPIVKRLAFGQNFNFKKADWLYMTVLTKPHYETCKKWLDSREIGSVIYVSFGSLVSLREKQMEELAFGLIMSNSYFLWVVRDTEENKLPNEFKSKASEKGLIVDWSPQLDVLAHKSIGCFFSHCGWNSTLEALILGVPMVCMPQWVDQPTNAKFISDIWRTGIRVKAGKDGVITREEIASSIKEVMVEKKGVMLKENAIKWKILAKEAIDKGGSSYKNIEEFIEACNALN
nr:UDP-glycosyltransferase [Nicotiana tabacum]